MPRSAGYDAPASMSKKRPPAKHQGPRAVRRAADRDAVKLARDVQRLEELAPGGAPARPIQLVSASEVETTALGRPCPICGGGLRLEAHDAVEDPAAGRLRVARLACTGCRAKWSRWFRLGPPLVN
jgi:hypothetical protein